MKKITVTAAPGCTVVFPKGTITAAGASVEVLRGAMPAIEKHDIAAREADKPIEVPYDRFVRARLRAGDLVQVRAADKEAIKATLDKLEAEGAVPPAAELKEAAEKLAKPSSPAK